MKMTKKTMQALEIRPNIMSLRFQTLSHITAKTPFWSPKNSPKGTFHILI